MIQDEIREAIAKLFVIARKEGELTKYADGIADADEALTYLDSKGCVISIPDSPDEPDDFYYGEKGPPIIKDGMAIVKPLIKE